MKNNGSKIFIFLFRDLFNSTLNLHDLSLASNLLPALPLKTLSPLTSSLRTLDLGENRLSGKLDEESLRGLSGLRGLRLAGNGIDSVGEGTFRHARSVRMLNLADNRIETIHQDAFTPLKKLKVGQEISL